MFIHVFIIVFGCMYDSFQIARIHNHEYNTSYPVRGSVRLQPNANNIQYRETTVIRNSEFEAPPKQAYKFIEMRENVTFVGWYNED